MTRKFLTIADGVTFVKNVTRTSALLYILLIFLAFLLSLEKYAYLCAHISQHKGLIKIKDMNRYKLVLAETKRINFVISKD